MLKARVCRIVQQLQPAHDGADDCASCALGLLLSFGLEHGQRVRQVAIWVGEPRHDGNAQLLHRRKVSHTWSRSKAQDRRTS